MSASGVITGGARTSALSRLYLWHRTSALLVDAGLEADVVLVERALGTDELLASVPAASRDSW
jgi:hypothetical protein